MIKYKKLSNEELNDFTERVVVQLEPHLTQQVLSVILELDEYRSKIEDKTLIEPPCKVGDTVYYFLDIPGFYDIIEFTVEDIVIRLNPFKCILHCKNKNGNWDSFCDDSFGKTLFFTKAEAEAKLKELKGK